MTPRNPWSFFLNFFWSKIWTVTIEESLTSTSKDSFQSVTGVRCGRRDQHSPSPPFLRRFTPTDKGSGFSAGCRQFQYLILVRLYARAQRTLMAVVVLVCSPSTVTTANGSGRRNTSRFANESAATTAGVGKQLLVNFHFWQQPTSWRSP